MIFQFLCIGLYAVSLILLWRSVKVLEQQIPPYRIYLVATIAVAMHAISLFEVMHVRGDILISIGTTISIAGWISAILYLLLSLKLKFTELGLVVYPLSIVAVSAGFIQPENTVPLSQFSDSVRLHILIAIPTYAVLFMAFSQACLLRAQDRNMRKGTGGFISNLPPIQSMESYLFVLIICGFVLMTFNLVLGIFTYQIQSGRILSFNHHVVFSIAAWIIFAMTIAGRYAIGWRGELAAKWTMIAFSLLFIAYFGTRFVNELVLP
ncbi:MAG: hypothetical protein F4X92_09360 [Gammaproteobacteria bacterium]|nr:hypothetical protein [Gammaproteobacteria bacterium]